MYAIIKTGGNKQYRVKVGDVIDVELLQGDAGDQVEFGEVLLTENGSETQVGQPSVPGCCVYGEVLGEVSGPKVTGLKYKASHNQCRKWGHRQKYTRVKIIDIGDKRQHTKDNHHGT